ncbi:hypothetical protein OKA05_00885 [Luteolibacter arcticus]|uniref:Uncharacterized protein n=1 Tax=Luteolibacter arcticus TaxID=1581411 RepID=A0ABT3GBT4_9BACT|nr:hypothetical protein [Luteolibacter arcticus]MCW1921086.1 hypothetical protein [Luteolibacter arcticus]
MTPPTHNCAICGDLLIAVEAALNQTWFSTGFGSSQLQIRMKGKGWMQFMKPGRSAAGFYCTKCGALTIAPSIRSHRKELGLE